ncbi:hypothetical protein [Nonomuraea sp. NPDC050786]|uniref:hypothetical protein n=1 Tax=Nonomuraea sp. NPDC050786 TaxID=3154840 RepID=UPI0033F30CA7
MNLIRNGAIDPNGLLFPEPDTTGTGGRNSFAGGPGRASCSRPSGRPTTSRAARSPRRAA